MALQNREENFLQGQFRTHEVSLPVQFLVLETQTHFPFRAPLILVEKQSHRFFGLTGSGYQFLEGERHLFTYSLSLQKDILGPEFWESVH